MRARLQSGAQRGAACTDGMYAEFKGTPAERSEGRKVSSAEQDQLLTRTACAPRRVSVYLQVRVYTLCFDTCMLLCVHKYAGEHAAKLTQVEAMRQGMNV